MKPNETMENLFLAKFWQEKTRKIVMKSYINGLIKYPVLVFSANIFTQ